MPRPNLKPMYPEIVRLYETGYSYGEGAKMLGIPKGSFAGTIYKLRRLGCEIKRLQYVDQSHRVTAKAVSLPKLKFMEDQDES